MNADEPSIPADPYGMADDLDTPSLTALYDVLNCTGLGALAAHGRSKDAQEFLWEASIAATAFDPESDLGKAISVIIGTVEREAGVTR